LVATTYAIKFAWSPLVDNLRLPLLNHWLGRRRSWLLIAQVAVICGLVGMAMSDPLGRLSLLVGFALFTAFASATQDIVIDAYRIECARPTDQAALAATYLTGYRLGMIVGGAGVLLLAAYFDPNEKIYFYSAWRAAYLCMAGTMLVGVLTTLFIGEPRYAVVNATASESLDGESFSDWIKTAILLPFVDFFGRHAQTAGWILALIATYRITDIVMGVIANVFYQDLGYTKVEVAQVAKVFGVLMTLLGAFVGGALVPKVGLTRLLLLGAVLVVSTNLLFAWLAYQPPRVLYLALVISADNLSAGLATVAFVAYLSALTNVRFSATQYALFSSLMLLLPKFVAGGSGWLVDQIDYPAFFVVTALMGVPVIFLILWLRRIAGDPAVVVVKAPSDIGAG